MKRRSDIFVSVKAMMRNMIAAEAACLIAQQLVFILAFEPHLAASLVLRCIKDGIPSVPRLSRLGYSPKAVFERNEDSDNMPDLRDLSPGSVNRAASQKPL